MIKGDDERNIWKFEKERDYGEGGSDYERFWDWMWRIDNERGGKGLRRRKF